MPAGDYPRRKKGKPNQDPQKYKKKIHKTTKLHKKLLMRGERTRTLYNHDDDRARNIACDEKYGDPVKEKREFSNERNIRDKKSVSNVHP